MAGDLIVSGLTGTAFDGGAIVEQLLQLRSIPIQRLEREKALVQAKLSSLGNLSSAINDFYSIFNNLDIDKLFQKRKVTVGDDSILSATATEEAPLISFSVTVNRLAKAEMRVSNGGVSDLTTGFSSSGTLTLTYDTGSGTQSFNIDYSAGETLENLVDKINSAQGFVKASVYYDGTSYRLMLTEKDLGSSTVETNTGSGVYAINVTGLPSELGTDLDTLQVAQNAELVIGSGSPVTSPTNEFKDIISGMTITVKAQGTTDVTVKEDYSKVRSFLGDFVEKFNALVELADSLTVGESPLFAGDGTIRGVRIGVVERLDPLIEKGLIDYDGNTGKISLNTDRLNELLEQDPEAVKGVITQIKDNYSNYLEQQKDVFKSFEQTFNDRIERIDERIRFLAERLVQEERILRREFARLEAFIAEAEELRARFRQFMVSLSRISGGGDE